MVSVRCAVQNILPVAHRMASGGRRRRQPPLTGGAMQPIPVAGDQSQVEKWGARNYGVGPLPRGCEYTLLDDL